jgi:tryptophan-rich sensory protein
MRLLLFLLLNFGALYVGALFMGQSPAENEWYQSLSKAPWTPPGWVFGAAWTTIMICYAVYLSSVVRTDDSLTKKRLILSYALQLFLNVFWNPLFFNWHLTELALFCILSLLAVIVYQLLKLSPHSVYLKLLLLPYALWLGIAVSLNFFVVLMN